MQAQGVNKSCALILKELTDYDTDNPLQVEIVVDSTRVQWDAQSAAHFYRVDTASIRSGPAATYYFDGYILSGQYSLDQRQGIWTLYDCNRDMRIVDEYHFKQGIVEGVVTKRRIKKNKLKSIPLIF